MGNWSEIIHNLLIGVITPFITGRDPAYISTRSTYMDG